MEAKEQIEGNIDKKNVKHKHGSRRTEMEDTNQQKSTTHQSAIEKVPPPQQEKNDTHQIKIKTIRQP